jgi:hypothetical protein
VAADAAHPDWVMHAEATETQATAEADALLAESVISAH